MSSEHDDGGTPDPDGVTAPSTQPRPSPKRGAIPTPAAERARAVRYDPAGLEPDADAERGAPGPAPDATDG